MWTGCERTADRHEKTVEKVKRDMPVEDELRDLAQVLQMTPSAISHQLRALKQMKLVKNRREGKTVYYSLADDHILTIISQGMEHIAE